MHLVAIGWIYVALMMAVAEATSTTGTVLGAFFTFVLYGVAPVSLVLYLMGTPGRKRKIKAREAAELAVAPVPALMAPWSGMDELEKKALDVATVAGLKIKSTI